MNKSLKKRAVIFLSIIVFLFGFLDNLQVISASGGLNVISFGNVRMEGFNRTAEWEPSMGNIGEVTVNMPGFTLTNVRLDSSTGELLYDLVLDQPIVMTSGSRANWWSDMQRSREFEITVYVSNGSNTMGAGYHKFSLEEKPGSSANNTLRLNANDLIKRNYYYWDMNNAPPNKIYAYITATDAHHAINEFYNGWRNRLSVDIPTQPLTQNSPPVLTISTPSDQQLSENSLFVPVVRVSDVNNDRLEINYYIDSEGSPRESKVATNTVTAQTVSFSPLNMSTISEGLHTLRFTVSDGKVASQGSINIIVDKSNPLLGNVNITSSDSQIRMAGTAYDAISGLDSAPYRYTVGTQSSGWTAEPGFTASGLSANTLYRTKFEARDRVGHIAVSERNAYTQAQAPALSIQQNGETSVKILLNDNNSPGTPYMIQTGSSYVTSTGVLTSSPVWITPSVKTIVLNGLQANTTYPFQAKSKNAEGQETAFGAVASGTTLAKAPSGLTADASQAWIKLTWPASPSALGYDVEADGLIFSNGNATVFTHSGLLANTQHSYRVRVRNAGGTGNWSQTFTKLTLPDPPQAPVNLLTAPSQRFITLTWDLVAKAVQYEVEADGKVVDNGGKNTFVHQGLEPLTDHIYRVRAINTGGASGWSNSITQKTWPDPPATPTKLSAIPEIHSIAVKWDEMEGATSYEIEVDGLIMDNKNSVNYTHKGLDALTGHTYRVRAVNIGGKSAWSVPLDVTTHPEIPDVPTNIMTTSDVTEITAAWYTVPHTDSYDVEIDGGSIVNVTENSFVHDQLAANSSHTYRIRAKNISGDSEWSKRVTLSTMPEKSNTESLTNIVAVVTNKAITLSWDTASPEARYDIEVDGRLLDNGTDTVYNHTGLRPEEYHTYKIRVKQGTEIGDWVAVLSLSTLPNLPGAPSKIDAVAKNNSIELHWQKIEGANGYQLEIDGKAVDIGSNTSYLHNNLPSGTAHTYRLRAMNATGVTAWSPSLQKSTTSPDYIIKVKKGEECSLTLLAQNVQDFSEMSFVVSYDPNELELSDLYDFTPFRDLTNGKIPGSNLTASYSPGKITFTIDQNIVPGTSWSGEITTLSFKSLKTGETSVHVVVD